MKQEPVSEGPLFGRTGFFSHSLASLVPRGCQDLYPLKPEVDPILWTGIELVKLESSTPIHCQAGTSSGVRLTSDWCTWFLPSSNTWAGVL